MKNQLLGYKRKWSMFSKWVFGIIVVVIAVIIAYILCDIFGVITCIKFTIAEETKAAEHATNNDVSLYTSMTVVAVIVFVFGYVILALYNLLSHRAEEDSRMHCLPIIYSPVFLIIENGLLHLFDLSLDKDNAIITTGNAYYSVTMTVISAIVVGVITFSSLKLSFEISSQRKRFEETAIAKPDITVTKCDDETYKAEIKNNDCYLSGIYYGTIDKTLYRDIKRTGNMFYMRKIYFPNIKKMYEKDSERLLDFSMFLDDGIDTLCNEAKNEGQDIFLIFRDKQNYYYFVQLPYKDNVYNAIGVNEHTITRLLYKSNRRTYAEGKRKKSDKRKHKKSIAVKRILYKFFRKKFDEKAVVYESMDWFKIPYNFFPNNN